MIPKFCNNDVNTCHDMDDDYHRHSWSGHPTWTWDHVDGDLEPLDVEGALVIADFYGGVWDEECEQHGMAVALEVLANHIRQQHPTTEPRAD